LIAAAWADDDKAQRLAQGARDFVRANYSWPVLAAAVLEQYRSVVKQSLATRA
jgi:glycosyltransferase involved in cell wall biosynthesis